MTGPVTAEEPADRTVSQAQVGVWFGIDSIDSS